MSCDRNESKPVVYLEIDSLTLKPDASRGTSSTHIRSVWVESEGVYFGVFPSRRVSRFRSRTLTPRFGCTPVSK